MIFLTVDLLQTIFFKFSENDNCLKTFKYALVNHNQVDSKSVILQYFLLQKKSH